MSLQLVLHLPETQIGLGTQLVTQLVLRNVGSAPVETASLSNNNKITNYVLSDEHDRVLVRVNQVTRQLLFEKTEPRTTDQRLIELAPQATDERVDNLCRYHWLSAPGIYHLRGLYRFGGQELVTEPVRFEVLRAPLVALDSCWNYHYGERFALFSAWTAPRADGEFEIVLRESARFAPQVINSNAPLWLLPEPVAPRTSFNRSLLSGGAVWVAWLGGGALNVLCPGTDPLLSGSVQLPAGAWEWVFRPLCAADGAVTCILCARDEGLDLHVLGIRFDKLGQETARAELTLLDPSVSKWTGCCDAQGGFALLYADDLARELYAQRIDVDALTAAPPQRLGQTQWPWVALFAPPVLGTEGYVSTLSVDAEAHALCFEWWTLHGQEGAVKLQRMAYPLADQVTSCTGTMDSTQPVCLVRGSQHLDYVNPKLGQTLRLWHGEGPEPMTHEQLVVNARGDVFVSSSLPSVGIDDRRLHLGTDYDLAELEGT